MTVNTAVGYNDRVAVSVALDFFPARVTLPSGVELSPVRIFVVDDRVQVYILRDGRPVLYYDQPLVSGSGRAVGGYELVTQDGVVSAVKAGGCGCNHPLKSYNPWRGETRRLVKLVPA